MLQTSNWEVLLISFLFYSFLVHTKCQDLNLRAGRSRDQVMFKPSFNDNKTSLAVNLVV